MRCILAVDGGNSKAHALVADASGTPRGFGTGGPSNHQTAGLDRAMTEIARAAQAALSAAGLASESIELGMFCLAGADLPEDHELLQRSVERLGLCRSVVIRNDTLAALRAGASRPWGVVVICGAGFNAAGRAPDGREIILPGLGPISGDWGGGGDLGMEVVRLVMRAWDGRGQATLLTRRVLDAFAAESEETLLRRMYRGEIDAARVLDLVPLLFDAADDGDPVAWGLVQRMGEEVGVTAGALIRRLGLETTDVEVVLAGSVFKGRGPELVKAAAEVVRAVAPRAQIVPLRHAPVVGAALLGLDRIGVELPQHAADRLGAAVGG